MKQTQTRIQVKDMITDFVRAIDDHIQNEIRSRVVGLFGGEALESKSNGASNTGALTKKPRRKPPRQLCPVPGCKETAAPIFGMVCRKHNDVPKKTLEKYREARRAKKAKK